MAMDPMEYFRAHGQRAEVPQGTVLYDYAQPWEGCFFLEKGCCALSVVTRTGEERTLLYWTEKRLIGFMDALGAASADQSPMPILVTAKTPCALYRLSAAALAVLLESDGDFSRYMTKVLAENFHQLLRRFHASLEENATVRLCRTLLEFAEQSGEERIMPPYLTYVELSRYLSLHTVTVSRIMSHLKRLGYVEGKGRRIVLRNQSGLERLIAEGINLDRQE